MYIYLYCYTIHNMSKSCPVPSNAACLHPEVAVSAFVVAYAVNYAITKSHKIPPPLYVPGCNPPSHDKGVSDMSHRNCS